ncbi:COQ9 family protein [Chachezhania sediminis]|uniref:COQ9 family protein n=1 Tax=Chachezhania sediminis TaxID=2599291 RepID=UPI0018EF235D|nr:COQ9 family protein [Chachezhania sediminis]
MIDEQTAGNAEIGTGFDSVRDKVLDAALLHVVFDGWSEATLKAAIADAGVEPALARAIFPRGGVDLALAYHDRGDGKMLERLAETDLSDLKFRERIAAAVRFRLEAVEDRDLVRRGMTLFALPLYAGDGAKAVWQTCDRIWSALGDTSEDVNWYTKRATLSAVYSSTLLFWLGDDSDGSEATWAFLDRRIENVMQFETVKAKVNGNPLLKPFLALPNRILGQVRAPSAGGGSLFPGRVSGRH